LTAGLEELESSLHENLAEHLNAEIVLQTILDLPTALSWVSSTFLYVRASKNPTYYGEQGASFAGNGTSSGKKRLKNLS
jgi:ATP-dependent DNA helicase HFM1/MER3